VACLAACSEPAVTDRAFPAFGTTVHIQIRDTDPGSAAAAADEIERRFQTAGKDWYAFGTGELARVNSLLARGEAAPVSPALAPLIRRAMDLHTRSGGQFDPAVCALVRLWQFDSEESLAGAAAPPPDAEVQALRARQGTFADLSFDGRTASARRPLCIDLGGMAKGSALEQARAILRRHGVTSALLDLGGSSQLAIGRKGSGRWTIGLRHPRANRVIGRLGLEDGEAASTSGDYERGYVTNGHRYRQAGGRQRERHRAGARRGTRRCGVDGPDGGRAGPLPGDQCGHGDQRGPARHDHRGAADHCGDGRAPAARQRWPTPGHRLAPARRCPGRPGSVTCRRSIRRRRV
jgi:thiamine biosynthesis lipoprotein